MTSSAEARADARVAIVTGGAQGIGRAVVERFVQGGYRVLLVDVDAAGADEVADTLGDAVHPLAVDLADTDQRARVVPEAITAFGRLDVLVNNAGTTGPRVRLTDLGDDDLAQVIATNLIATIALARDAATHLPDGGAIVDVASIQELLPLERHIPYIASKGGVSSVTRALAVELGPAGIRVNAVRPGVIETPSMTADRRALGLPEDMEQHDSPTLLRRSGRPEDIAEAVWFLASDAASFVTGASLTVDGGRSLSRRPDPLERGTHA